VNFDDFIGAFTDAISLVEKNWKSLLIDFTKVTLLSYIPLLIGFILLFVIGLFELSSGIEGIIALMLFLIGFIAYFIIDSVSLNVPDNIVNGKRVMLIDQAGKNAIPMVQLSLVIILLITVGIAVWNVGFILSIIVLMVAIAGLFIFQFTMYELILGRKSFIASVAGSLELVKSNIPNVIVFDIVFLIIMALMYFAEQVIFGVLASLAALITLAFSLDPLLMSASSLILLIILVLAIIVGAVISYFLYVLPFYFFWSRITKRIQPVKQQENIKKPTTQ